MSLREWFNRMKEQNPQLELLQERLRDKFKSLLQPKPNRTLENRLPPPPSWDVPYMPPERPTQWEHFAAPWGPPLWPFEPPVPPNHFAPPELSEPPDGRPSIYRTNKREVEGNGLSRQKISRAARRRKQRTKPASSRRRR